MKKVLLAVMVFAMSSFAQIGLDVAGEFAMPMGDFGDTAGMGFGGTVKAYYPINEQIDVTGKVGYIYFMTHEDFEDYGDANWTMIPIMFGGRYKMTPEFYGSFELGMTMISMDYEYEYMGYTWKFEYDETEMSYAIGAGYIMDKFDFSAFFNSVMTEGDACNHIGLRVGYKFM